jgi:hypothetical protein
MVEELLPYNCHEIGPLIIFDPEFACKLFGGCPWKEEKR